MNLKSDYTPPLSTLSQTNKTSFSDDSTFGPRIDTASDFSNFKNDLEWDRHKDFNLMLESDTMSSYNLEERMDELVKLNFLNFEIMSSNSSCFKLFNTNNEERSLSVDSLDKSSLKRPNRLNNMQRKHRSSLDESNSYFSDIQSNLFTPPNAITLDDLFDFKRLTQTLHTPHLVSSFSLPDLSEYSNGKRIYLESKHLSLLHIGHKFHLVYHKRNSIRVSDKRQKDKLKCPCENGFCFSERIKKIVQKFSNMFSKVFDNGGHLGDDELKASYSVASESLTYKLNSNEGAKLKLYKQQIMKN